MFSKYRKHVLEVARLVVMGDLLYVDNLREEIRSELICFVIDGEIPSMPSLNDRLGGKA